MFRRITISLMFLLLLQIQAANALFGFGNKTPAQITAAEKKAPGELRFAFISDIYLYPVPVSQEKFKSPKSQVGIMYSESQVLLQELVRDLIKNQEKNQLDFVLFGGSQVANNYHWDLFLDIADELSKNQINYYFLVGDGEYLGPNPLGEIIEEKYFHKKINNVNFLALDNARDTTYIKELEWLNQKIKELKNDGDDVFVFSYRPLKTELLEVVETIPNLKLIANSYDLKYNYIKSSPLAPLSPENPAKNYTYVSNPSLSVYPCAYTIITRKTDGEIKIEPLLSSLKGVRKKAAEQIKTLGLDPKNYEFNLPYQKTKWGLP